MNAVFDTNIVIDALNGAPEAGAEYGRYERVFISRVTWMEVLVGAQDDDAQLRDFMETYFEIVALDFTESILEEAVLEYLGSLKWEILFGPEIAPGEPAAERSDYHQVLLEGRLRRALERLNPSLPPEAMESAFRKVVNLPHLHPGLAANNHAFHRMLTDGVDVEYRAPDGRIAGDRALLGSMPLLLLEQVVDVYAANLSCK